MRTHRYFLVYLIATGVIAAVGLCTAGMQQARLNWSVYECQRATGSHCEVVVVPAEERR